MLATLMSLNSLSFVAKRFNFEVKPFQDSALTFRKTILDRKSSRRMKKLCSYHEKSKKQNPMSVKEKLRSGRDYTICKSTSCVIS